MKNVAVFFLLFLISAAIPALAIESSRVTETSKVIAPEAEKKVFEVSPEMKEAMSRRGEGDEKNTLNVVDGLTNGERFIKYLNSGFVHIIPKGIDHILFVLGLFLSTIVFRKLVWQVTTFTLAHSISLGLAASGVIQIGANVIEPLIALSIAYIAFENIRQTETNSSRLVIIFIIGLLHGLGFAFVLAEFGLPDTSFLMSLFAFNIGVELGQLAVLVSAIVVLYNWSTKPSYRLFVQIPGSILIGFVGVYWTIERLFNI